MTTPKPLCPKCKSRNLMKDGRTPAGAQRWSCARRVEGKMEYCYTTTNPEAPYRDQAGRTKKVEVRKKFKRKIDTSKYMVFTAAQNATPVHELFFDALKSFADDMDAELCVIPIRYKNATSVWTESQQNAEHWLRDVAERELAEDGITKQSFTGHPEDWIGKLDDYASKYLYEQRRKLNNNLVVVGDMKVQPTAADPLTSLEGLTHGESGIFGHTKLRLKCVATPQNRMPKILTTTGACTQPNYTDTPTGKKGEFHHVLGAVVVQIESPSKFHLYHINARKSDGAFIFMESVYYADGRIERAPPAQALIFGDAHYRFADSAVVDATFGEHGLVDRLNPEKLVWHDLLDCYFGNPHHGNNPFIRKAKHEAGFHIAKDEVEETIAWMKRLSKGRVSYIAASNHDDMFARWVIREDWKELPPENMEFYLETALQMARSARMSEIGAEYLDPFAYWIDRLTNPADEIYPLKQNESLTIADIECSYHGDKGPRGARGTIKNLSQIGVKVISGHGHSPAIQDGHTRTGTMTRLTAEYVDGPNDWLNAHASIDAFGKRHLHFCIDGSFGF